MKKERGRPSSYSEKAVMRALHLATKGKTHVQIAKALNIAPSTLSLWMEKHPDFSEALKKAKEISDDDVERSLRERALGYKHKAVKFFMHEGVILSQEYQEIYPPDVTACIFWLKNRRPDRWREKQREDDAGELKNLTITQLILNVLPHIPRDILQDHLKKLEAAK